MGMLAPVIERAQDQLLSGTDLEAVEQLRGMLRGLGFSDSELAEAGRYRGRAFLRRHARARRRAARRFRALQEYTRSIEDAEGMLRVAHIVDHAIQVFGGDEKAIRWLRTKNHTLGGSRPIDLLQSETGARRVEEVLYRVDYGVYA